MTVYLVPFHLFATILQVDVGLMPSEMQKRIAGDDFAAYTSLAVGWVGTIGSHPDVLRQDVDQSLVVGIDEYQRLFA